MREKERTNTKIFDLDSKKKLNDKFSEIFNFEYFSDLIPWKIF
jgi:hypothetical protein